MICNINVLWIFSKDPLLACLNSESRGPSENRISGFLILNRKGRAFSLRVIRKSNLWCLITAICCHIRYEVSSFHDEQHVSSIVSCLSCLETKTDYRNRLVWHGLYDKLNWAISENARILSGVVKMESHRDLKRDLLIKMKKVSFKNANCFPKFFYKICIFSLGNCHLPSLHPAQSLMKTIKL